MILKCLSVECLPSRRVHVRRRALGSPCAVLLLHPTVVISESSRKLAVVVSHRADKCSCIETAHLFSFLYPMTSWPFSGRLRRWFPGGLVVYFGVWRNACMGHAWVEVCEVPLGGRRDSRPAQWEGGWGWVLITIESTKIRRTITKRNCITIILK